MYRSEGIVPLSSKEEILNNWQKFRWGDKLTSVFGNTVTLVDHQIETLKDSRKKTSIWKLVVTDGIESIPVVLKIFKLPLKENQMVEINMYQRAYTLLQEFMPQMYWIENVNKEEIWLFTQYVKPLRGQIKLVPKHLEQIIPTVANFHALTFENRFLQHAHVFDSWLPRYDSKLITLERSKHIEKTKEYLDKAMKEPGLREMVEPSYNVIHKILQKGPIFFPEIMEAGQSLIHGDLHIHNVCCTNVNEQQAWPIQLIDWESVKYAPVWYDLVVLVELLIDFRKDWHKKAEDIRSHCVHLYSKEMQSKGIVFHEDPLNLLKMTYLQRVLEKRLLNHLRRVLNGEKSALLGRYLEKIVLWGKELGLL
ncbi:phosphotransferase family enzyme [Aneurinibacillus soli]|uniref:Phosphotransferase enzyme family protein n=1 Tax=Aneurinibacillus soli TaxID=1500254 RepID=A0A0U5BJD5_9BACL|nr:phosphotransferase family enzyme [Aneurinibacillus soli]BAU28302.1 Phosphotransferase enzyme family protein [Aneurinibacillus soli]